MQSLLHPLLPVLLALASVQSARVPQFGKLDQQCAKEVAKISECRMNVGPISPIDDVSLPNKSKNLAAIAAINKVLDCSDNLNCTISQSYRSYFTSQKYILEQLHGPLESCLFDTGLLSQVNKTCSPPDVDMQKDCEGKYINIPGCIRAEAKKYPEQCSDKMHLISRWLGSFVESCSYMGAIHADHRTRPGYPE